VPRNPGCRALEPTPDGAALLVADFASRSVATLPMAGVIR
jgi:hypothetical protein